MKQPYNQLVNSDVCRKEKLVLPGVRQTAVEKSSPEPAVWSFARPDHPQSAPLGAQRAAIFAHEIANSFTAVGCCLQFVMAELEAQGINDPILSKVVQAALASLDSAESLVDEYCTQSEDSKSPWKLADFGTVVEDFLHLQAVVCRAAGISVSFERDLELPRVRLDALKIKQVIANLCKNANEAMPRGGNLVLKVFRAQQMVVLEVSDSGIGMPRGLNVFELFKTTKASGHGVGLALAQEIISAHRGTISFTSEPNRGTTFRVSLPIEE